jgi:hypothetical protein
MIELICTYPLDRDMFVVSEQELKLLKMHYNHFMYQVRGFAVDVRFTSVPLTWHLCC